MLKLYTDIKLLNKENRSQVFPLLFDLHFSKNQILFPFYSLVEKPENAAIIVMPLDYGFMLKNHRTNIELLIWKAKELKKVMWIYTGGDYGFSLKDSKTYNFRLGGFKSNLNNRTIILPSFVSDPYNNALKGNFKPLEKEVIPRIGFVGHAKGGYIKFIKEFLIYLGINIKRLFKIECSDYQPFYPSGLKRSKYLKNLQLNRKIKTDFIFRNKYRAGIKGESDRENTTREFYKNIYKNPYTFCMRGGGNFSVRFYETLAVGRIPVLLNTDCLLPLDSLINWQQHCVILDESEYRSLGNKIVNFHSDLNDVEFVKLQESNRKLWEDILTRHSYFKVIHDLFVAKLN